MNRRVVRVLLGLPLLACLLGADDITFAKDQPVRKPLAQGQGAKLEATGTVVVDPANDLESVTYSYYARSSGQTGYIPAKVDRKTWSATLQLVPGDYEVWAELISTDKKTGVRTKTETKPVKVTIEKTGKV